MVLFPPCKINLGLHVLSKRSDGFHAIETGFYPVPWTDVLEVIPTNDFAITFSGITIPGEPDDNLCRTAYELLKRDFNIGPVHIHLHKIVPVGAGLGGGSSDAAMTLHALNQIFSLNLTTKELQSYASRLGSDCAFFIDPRPMLGTDKGETLTPLSLELGGKHLLLINPGISVSTQEAYRGVSPREPEISLSEILTKPITKWKDILVNDFEPSVFKRHPVLLDIKKKLYERGANYASLSGSGATVYGLFDHVAEVRNDFVGLQVWSGILTQ